jgi:hypothetical protein
MRYYKIEDGEYITAIATGLGGTEITEQEYTALMAIIKARPVPPDGHDYILKVDLTWEQIERPSVPDDDEISDADALAIITGVV